MFTWYTSQIADGDTVLLEANPNTKRIRIGIRGKQLMLDTTYDPAAEGPLYACWAARSAKATARIVRAFPHEFVHE